MTNTSMGRSEMKECPHKTVSRFYDSPASNPPIWKCDWCGQEFRAVVGESNMVELKEIGTGTVTSNIAGTGRTTFESSGGSNDLKASDPYDSASGAAVSGPAHGSDLDARSGDDSAPKVEALPDRGAAPSKRLRRV